MYKNRILIFLGLVAGLIFFGIESFATSTGVVNTETARMRAEANTTSNIVALVSQDEKVEILEKSGDWYKVKYKDNTGYIYAQYVDNKDNKSEQSTNNTTAPNNTVSNTTINNETENNNAVENTQTSVEVSTTVNETNTGDETIIENNTQILVVEDASLKLVPLINSTEIKSLKANIPVTVLDYANGWYFVNSEDAQGWVRKEKLDTLKQTQKESENKTEETVAEDTTTETEEKAETKTTKYVNVEKANLREKASKDSSTVKSISKNTAVTVVGTEETWSKVEVDGKTGYILSELLSSDKVKESTNNTTKDKNTTSTKNNVTNRGEEVDRSQSANSGNVVSYASSFLGTRYILGGASPSGFDCSGFTMYVYGKYGVNLAHSARAQASVGTAVDRANLEAGDLVLFKGATGNSIGHVGIYIGGNNFIHASNPSDGVKITSMSTSYYKSRYVTSRRVF